MSFEDWYLKQYGHEPFTESTPDEEFYIQQAQRTAYEAAVQLTLDTLVEIKDEK